MGQQNQKQKKLEENQIKSKRITLLIQGGGGMILPELYLCIYDYVYRDVGDVPMMVFYDIFVCCLFRSINNRRLYSSSILLFFSFVFGSNNVATISLAS